MGRGGALVERRLRAGPYSPQLAQEQADGHRSPAGQHIQGLAQFGVAGEPLADHRGLPAVTLADHLRQGLQPVRGPEVVPGVSALIEASDQAFGRDVAGLADPGQATAAAIRVPNKVAATNHRSTSASPASTSMPSSAEYRPPTRSTTCLASGCLAEYCARPVPAGEVTPRILVGLLARRQGPRSRAPGCRLRAASLALHQKWRLCVGRESGR
jgi:hypothetical protein